MHIPFNSFLKLAKYESIYVKFKGNASTARCKSIAFLPAPETMRGLSVTVYAK